MVTLTYAYTAPINPPNVNPVLTRPKVFASLRRKVRNAHEFVPIIIGCNVLKEDGNVVTREVLFKEGEGPSGWIKEVCVEHYPTKVPTALSYASIRSQLRQSVKLSADGAV
jgi:hypothetical protein